MELYEQILMDEAFRTAAIRYLETVEERLGSEILRALSTRPDPKELAFREQYLKILMEELDLTGTSGALAICGYLKSVIVPVEDGTKSIDDHVKELAWNALFKSFSTQLQNIVQRYEIAGRL